MSDGAGHHPDHGAGHQARSGGEGADDDVLDRGVDVGEVAAEPWRGVGEADVPEQLVTHSEEDPVREPDGHQREERVRHAPHEHHGDPDRRWQEHQRRVDERARADEPEIVEHHAWDGEQREADDRRER